MHAQYFDRSGRQLSEEEALGPGRILKDGIIARTRLTMRDGAMHRPGFRRSRSDVLFGDQLASDAKREANEAHRHYLENAWRNPITKLADATEDEDDAADAMVSATHNEQNDDKRSVARIMADHQRTMQSVYDSYSSEISQAWKVAK